MIRTMCRVAAVALSMATVYGAAPASAEPVNVLGGTISYSRQNQAIFDLTLLNGWMQGEFGDNASEEWTPAHACFQCVPGSTITPSVTENMPVNADVAVGGVLNYRGASYFISKLSFTIDSDPVTLPSTFDVGDGLARSSIAQFVLRGLVEAWTPDHFSGQGLSLLGYGKANMTFLSDGSWFSTTYQFENPAAVPEPGTLLLFGTGAAVVARYRRRRLTDAV